MKNDVLYKVGWSKTDNKEYVHKVPKDGYENVVRAISDLGKNGSTLFTSEQLATILESNGLSVPIYQVYLTLSLLREQCLVEKQGRDGYSAGSDVAALGSKLWFELSSRDQES